MHVQFYLRFLYTRFPHLHCLHADSITRAIHMMYFTRYFHYLRNPYPQNDHYPQFHYTRIKSPQAKASPVAVYRAGRRPITLQAQVSVCKRCRRCRAPPSGRNILRFRDFSRPTYSHPPEQCPHRGSATPITLSVKVFFIRLCR